MKARTKVGREDIGVSLLGLLHPTPASWATAAEGNLAALLSDHAHCELKAAQSALGMIGRFGGDFDIIVDPLIDLAREESSHAKQVLVHLRKHGYELGIPSPDAYVNELRSAARSLGRAPGLLDRLLVSAVIEARSCERFQVLSRSLSDTSLSEFYVELMASEAKHFALFSGLATQLFGTEARERLRALAEKEAAIAGSLPLGPTVHG